MEAVKLVCISDTHGMHYQLGKLPDGDVLIHAGDFTMMGEDSAIRSFDEWLGEQPHKYKIAVAGNHDLAFHWRVPKPVLKNAIYLEDSGVTINGLNFWGSPWTPKFGYGWCFNADKAKMQEVASKIPDNTDVLITHGPPNGYLDWSYFGECHAGCPSITKRLEQLDISLHVFGHIHGGYGVAYWPVGTTFANASVVNEAYKVVNKPLVFDIGDFGD